MYYTHFIHICVLWHVIITVLNTIFYCYCNLVYTFYLNMFISRISFVGQQGYLYLCNNVNGSYKFSENILLWASIVI